MKCLFYTGHTIVSQTFMLYFFYYPFYTGNREEVIYLNYIFSFIVAVMAGVVCHYIIKWLDSKLEK